MKITINREQSRTGFGLPNVSNLRVAKTKVFLLAFLATTVSMSCSNNDVIDKTPVEIRLSSTNLASRSVVQTLQLTQFDENEKIGVFINEDAASPTVIYPQPLEYTANGSGGMTSSSTQYFPQSGKGVNIYAFYPFTAALTLTPTKSFSVKTDQALPRDYKASDLMYGVPATNPVTRTTGNVQLTFNHLLSKIDIELISGAGSPYLIDATVKLKGIKPETNFDPKEGSISAASGTATDIMVMTATSSLKGSAIIIPQSINAGDAFIEIRLPDGRVLTHKMPTNTTLEGRKKYSFKITVNLTGLTVTATIADWTSGGTVNGEAKLPPLTIDLTAQDGDYTATKNCIIDGKGQSLDKKIVIAADVEVILKNVILTPTTNGNGITCKGNATITLQGTNNIRGYNADGYTEYCGILVEAGTMIIDGTDDTFLNATGFGEGYGAGIGATNSANITINGGNITAQASYDSAGIGSAGWDHTCGDITITGGIINAIAGNYAAGIGGSNPGNCGNILITGGNIQATGGVASPGIGSGTVSSCGTIDITGEAVVVATKGFGAPVSIGRSLLGGSCGAVTITSPNVTQN